MCRTGLYCALLFLLPGLLRGQEKPPEALPLLKTQAGTLPIILSAPHGGRSPIPDCAERTGKGAAQFTTVLDTNTAELAEKVAEKLEARLGGKVHLVIARFERKYLDANRPPEDAYEADAARAYYEAYHRFLKEACKQVQREWGGGLLVDIHGQGVTADGIYRGTRDFKTLTLLRERHGIQAITGEKGLLGLLTQRKLNLLPANDSGEKETKFNGGHIVATYGSHQGSGVDAIQLEFGGDYRAKARLDRTADDLAAALEGFRKEYLPRDRAPRKER